MTLLTAPLPGLYLAFLAFLLARALRRWWDPVPGRVWAVFGVVLILLFGPALFLGKVLVPGDILPGARTAEAAAHPQGNTLQLDLVTQIVPWEAEVRRAVKAGRWPAWNGDAGAGMPLLADPQSQALEPLVLVGLPLPLWQAVGVTAGLKVLIALVFSFLLLRRQGMGEGPALFGALAFGLCGFVLLWLNWPIATPGALLPLVLYGLAVTDERGERRDFGLLVAALFALLVAGHPETILHVTTVGGLFGLSRLLRRERSARVGLVARWALAGGIALGLAAPALVPAARYIPQGLRHGQVARLNEFLRTTPLADWRTPDERQRSQEGLRRRFVPLFAPNAFGNNAYDSYWGEANSNEDASGFVGGAALLAALLAFLPVRRRIREERLFLGVALVSLAVTIRLPGVPWLLSMVPVYNQSVSGHRRLLMVLAFSLSYLAACTVERWRSGEGAPRRWAVIGAGVLLLSLIAWGYLGSPPPPGARDIESLRTAWLILQLVTVTGTGLILMTNPSLLSRRKGRRPGEEGRGGEGLEAETPPPFTRNLPRALPILLLILLAAELLVIHAPANPSLPRETFFPTTPAIAFIQQNASGSRMVGLVDQLLPNGAGVYGLADIRVSNPLKPQAYVEAVGPVSVSVLTTEHIISVVEHPIFQLLGVRWVLAPPGFKRIHGLRLAFHDPVARVFERRRTLPLLFLPEAAETPGAVPWPDWLAQNSDFGARALVAPVAGRPPVWAASRPEDSALQILLQQSARFSARALLAEDRLLATSVYQDGGWKLLLDGEPHRSLTANGPFLAAWLPAGEHRVEMIYRAPGLIPGLVLAALALAVLAAWLLWPVRPRTP